VDEAPFLKRFHVGHRGHIRTYKKRGSHITVVLSSEEKKVVPTVRVEEPKEKGEKSSSVASDAKAMDDKKATEDKKEKKK
jgi:hypothetical protein